MCSCGRPPLLALYEVHVSTNTKQTTAAVEFGPIRVLATQAVVTCHWLAEIFIPTMEQQKYLLRTKHFVQSQLRFAYVRKSKKLPRIG